MAVSVRTFEHLQEFVRSTRSFHSSARHHFIVGKAKFGNDDFD
jgi:hypothetical protein